MPQPYDYLLIVLAMAGMLGIGRLLFRSGDVFRDLLLGLLIVSITSAAFAWFVPVAVMPFLWASIGIGLVSIGFSLRSKSKILALSASWFDAARKEYVLILFSIFSAALLLLKLNLHFYKFTEDAVYFIPFLELRLADYVGALKFATYWPALQAASHLTFTTAMLALTALSPDASMLHAVEARYILVVIFCARLFFLSIKSSKNNRIFVGVSCVLIFYIYFYEVELSMKSSTMFYWMVITEISIFIISNPEFNKKSISILTCLGLSLVALKSVIIQIPIAFLLVFLFLFRMQVFSPKSFLMGTAVFLQTLALLFVPKPFQGLNVFPSLVDLKHINVMDYFSKMGDGLLNKDAFIAQFISNWAGVFMVFLLIFIKYIVIPMKMLDVVQYSTVSASKRVGFNILSAYIVLMFFSIIIVRNGGHGVTHQSWVIYTGSGFVIPILMKAVGTGKKHLAILVLAISVIYAGLGRYTPWQHMAWPSSPHFAGVTAHDLFHAPRAWVLSLHEGEFVGNVGLRALMLNTRLMKGEVPPSYSGPAGVFIVDGDQ